MIDTRHRSMGWDDPASGALVCFLIWFICSLGGCLGETCEVETGRQITRWKRSRLGKEVGQRGCCPVQGILGETFRFSVHTYLFCPPVMDRCRHWLCYLTQEENFQDPHMQCRLYDG